MATFFTFWKLGNYLRFFRFLFHFWWLFNGTSLLTYLLWNILNKNFIFYKSLNYAITIHLIIEWAFNRRHQIFIQFLLFIFLLFILILKFRIGNHISIIRTRSVIHSYKILNLKLIFFNNHLRIIQLLSWILFKNKKWIFI